MPGKKSTVSPLPRSWLEAVIPILERGDPARIRWTSRAQREMSAAGFAFNHEAYELCLEVLRNPGVLGEQIFNMIDETEPQVTLMKPKTHKTTFDIFLPATSEREERFVETIEVEVYRNFGEEILTPESSKRIEAIKARHLGIMTGEDIKSMRERLGISQKHLTKLLDCGEKSLSRWENGHGYPTGIVNKLLRLLDEGFVSPASLAAVSGPYSELSSRAFIIPSTNFLPAPEAAGQKAPAKKKAAARKKKASKQSQ